MKLKAVGFDGIVQNCEPTENSPEEPPEIHEETRKSVDEIAREVISGKWGSGAERKRRITEAGYDYEAVRKRVNQLLK